MRLTCPNCGAQYEVPDEVIPETGRDVQCSNCGDTWFQHHPDHPPAEDQAAEDEPHPGWDSPEEDEPDFAPEPEPDAEPEPELERFPEPEQPLEFAEEEPEQVEPTVEPELPPAIEEPEEAEAFAEDTAAEDEPEPEEDAADDTQLPPRRELDPAIADVLREEAAREQEARAAESGGLETQPDLGLDGQPSDDEMRSEQVRSRMARLRGLPEDGAPDPDPAPDPDLISRRNLLPDIDEINSSLDSESARADAAGADAGGVEGAARKGGFGRGFRRGVLLVVVLVVLYLVGPMIGDAVPALSGVTSAYVEAVNAGRLWLADMVGGVASAQ